MTYNTKYGNPGRYNASLPTVPDGEGAALAVDSNGRLITVGGGTGSATTVEGTAADNAAATGNPVLTGAEYNASAPTYTDGDVANNQADVNGNLKVTLATALDEDIDSVTSYEKGYTYTRLSADGVVSAVPVGLCGYYVEASGTGVISLYDNASAASGNAMLALSKSVTTNDMVLLETPILMTAGVFFDLVSGTATVSVLTRKTTSA